MAIYNIIVIGGIGYFLGAFLEAGDANLGNLLRCIGIVMSATCAVLIIMVPKLLTVQSIHLFIFNEVYKAHKMLEDDSETGKKSSDIASSQAMMQSTLRPKSQANSSVEEVSSSRTSKVVPLQQVELADMQAPNLESIEDLPAMAAGNKYQVTLSSDEINEMKMT